MYYISFRECKLWYLYVRNTHGWKQEQFITIKVTRKVIGIFILMVVLPFLKKFKIADINLLIAFNFLQGIGFFLGSLSMLSTGFLISGQQYCVCSLIRYLNSNFYRKEKIPLNPSFGLFILLFLGRILIFFN